VHIEIPADVFKKIAKRVEKEGLSSPGAKEIATQHAQLPDTAISINLNLTRYTLKVLKVISEEMKDGSVLGQRIVASLIRGLEHPEDKKINQIGEFVPLFKAWIKAMKLERNWLFSTDDNARPLAYLILNAEVIFPERAYRRSEPYIDIELCANSKHQFVNRNSITAYKRDVVGKTIGQFLLDKGYAAEDKDLLDDYDKAYTRYQRFRSQQAEQFWCRGVAYIEDEKSDSWWKREKKVDLAPTGSPSRCIQDEFGYEMGESGSERVNYRSELVADMCPVPTHPMLHCFHLGYHKYTWIHSYDLRPYEYEEDLESKVVMPASHSKLVDALTNQLFVPKTTDEGEKRSRVIRSKTQSTIILCKGPPGVGKTLTAEAYAEKMKRPLYEVQSGQIGVEPEALEEKLQEILERSKRLKAPLVINEADVFIGKRGNDMNQNAVVAAFLRIFEYHAGLIFLTTNRATDIDDAVVSRCLAIIEYKLPEEEERVKLWKILSTEMNLPLENGDCEKLASLFPNVSGRDIQNLIRLTARYMKAMDVKEPDIKVFRRCAVFRGITEKDK
jgi:hypothetical protein